MNNNEEKVKEIAHNLITNQVQDDWWYPRAQQHYEEALMEMANWKDEQLKETLKKKMDFFYPPIDDYNEGKLAVLKDLYQELFDEYYV